MSDENNTDCESCGRPLNESRDFKSLRAERDALAAQNETLKQAVMDRTIRDAGFDPNLGIVKRLAKDYDGDTADVDAFKTFATTEGLTPAQAEEPTQTSERTEVEQQLDALQAKGDALRAASTQQTPVVDLQQQINELEAAGKWAEAGRLKRQLPKPARQAS